MSDMTPDSRVVEAEAREAAIQARADACNAFPSSHACGEEAGPGVCWDCYDHEKTMKRVAEEDSDAERAENVRLRAEVERLRVESALGRAALAWGEGVDVIGVSPCTHGYLHDLPEYIAAKALDRAALSLPTPEDS